MDVDDNPAAEPIASMFGLTPDEARGRPDAFCVVESGLARPNCNRSRPAPAGSAPPECGWAKRASCRLMGFVEEAMERALNDFIDQGVGGSTSDWTEEKGGPPKRARRKNGRAPTCDRCVHRRGSRQSSEGPRPSKARRGRGSLQVGHRMQSRAPPSLKRRSRAADRAPRPRATGRRGTPERLARGT